MKYSKRYIIPFLIIVISIIFLIVVLLNDFFFDFFWNQELRAFLPNLEFFFRYITEFGSTLIYMGIFFTLFWAIDKNLAKKLIFIYISSNFINYYAKSIIGNSRPDQTEWILISASHLSTPSGHAMSSMVVWGYLGVKLRNILSLILSIIIIILVGLSRMYLGVHWFGDILTGWLFGLIIISGASLFEQFKIEQDKIFKIYLLIAFFGFIALIFTEFINIANYNFGTVGGQFIGVGIGLALEHKYISFQTNIEENKTWKIIVRIFIGILLVSILFLALYLIIDSDIFWQVSLHYIIVYIVGIFIWPFIFQRINL